MTVRFEVNGRPLEANDVRAKVDIDDDHTLTVLLGADGLEYYVVDPDGFVSDIGGVDYGSLLDDYSDLRKWNKESQ